ncbi:EAL domain-containing protein [Polynucleobacter kasalickyi]|uniref:PAS domain S-box-containing protein/diguanylate cyclase (GGDEF) domain-containing protein n=1 Tax=Polynucleobacter kasalickyi TaxID=1938817 RepID=A0A1W2B5V6_9BURK|nr:EAL domain-containing protein [Polynucleobacter kasalickyi]SMC68383.1 PAS domain S-box-containing protein/diguanylate cyclase (GGDEF) domain-containing protein [Polynucleobacter kasalickyi]
MNNFQANVKKVFRVLVIDDNEMIYEDFIKVLDNKSESNQQLDQLVFNLFGEAKTQTSNIQYQVDFAINGQTGLEMVTKASQENNPYLITFVDMRMPNGWNGLKTIQEIWKVQENLNIVLCTAHSDISWEDIHAALPTNDRFLILKKPFDTFEVKQIALTFVRRSEIEEKLSKNTEQLLISQRVARIGYFKLSTDYSMIETSEVIEDFLVYANQEMRNSLSKIQSLLTLTDAKKLSELIGTSKVSSEKITLNCRTNLKNSKEFTWVKISGCWIPENLSNQAHFIGSIQDISESKQQDQKVLLLETSLSQVSDMVMITDLGDETGKNHKILYVNESFEKQTGFKAVDVIGKNPRFLQGKKTAQIEIERIHKSLSNQEAIRVEILNYKANGDSFWGDLTISPIKDENQTVTHWMSVQRDVTSSKLALENIKKLAYFDGLTGLANRQLFNDRLSSTIQSSKRSAGFYALMLIDLDNFKELNDTFGHERGDDLLIQVSKRLKKCTREDDTVARLGGDEFVVLLSNIGTNISEVSANTEFIAKKINKVLSEEFNLKDSTYRTSASIGITIFGKVPTTPDDVLRQADIAMYQSKATGKNNFTVFNTDMQQIVLDRAAIADRLKLAIINDEFELFFQPQFDLSLELIGAEALMRWNTKDMGTIPPGVFIPIAEQNALIRELGNWVLLKAAYYLKIWSEIKEMNHLVMSVNVSTSQFSSQDFLSSVFDPMERFETSPEKLNLELTESIMVSDFEDLEKKLKILKSFGIKIALDDFGTGFSTLNYLKRLSLDELKIDQSFVQDLPSNKHDTAIARTIISLGQSLGLKVTAEGVETEGQFNLLRSLDCNQFQGYLFSKPIPALEFIEYAKNYNSNKFIELKIPTH